MHSTEIESLSERMEYYFSYASMHYLLQIKNRKWGCEAIREHYLKKRERERREDILNFKNKS